jgi:hypothetical protein
LKKNGEVSDDPAETGAGPAEDAAPTLVDETDDRPETPDAHWAEFEAADAAKAGEAPESAAAPTEPEPAAEPEPDQGASDAPAEPEAAKPEPAKAAPATAETKPAPVVDVWANATPEQLAERDRLIALERTHLGRVRSLQRQLDSGGKGGVVTPKAPKAAKSLQSEKGQRLRSEYPEVAEPIAEELDELRSTVAVFVEDREIARRNAAGELVERKHKGYEQTVASPDFAAWLSSQPAYVRAAAEKNGEWIVDATEAVDILDRYEAFRSAKSARTSAQDGNGARPNAEAGPSGRETGRENTGTSLSGRRLRQLESSAGTRVGGPGAASGIPEDGDPEAMWKAMDAEDARKARRA